MDILVIVWTLVSVGPDAAVGHIDNIVSEKDCQVLQKKMDTRAGLYTCVRTYMVREELVQIRKEVEK